MKYENCDEFLSSVEENEEIISKWEELSKKKKKISLISIISILIADIFFLYKMKYFSVIYLIILFFVDIFMFIIIQVIFINKDDMNFNKEYKEKIINKMLQNFIEDLDYIPLKGMPSNIYDEAQYGGYYNRYYSDDYFEGKINGQKIIMADLLVKEEKVVKDKDGNEEKETITVFNGLFGKINLNKSINTNLTITKDYGFSFFSKQKLEMDSYEFEKVFNVYADNNIIGMQLLTPDIQEDILELYNKYNINFHISIMDNVMYVLFNTGSMFEVFSTKKNPNKILEKYFEIMKFVYNLVEKIIATIDNTPI